MHRWLFGRKGSNPLGPPIPVSAERAAEIRALPKYAEARERITQKLAAVRYDSACLTPATIEAIANGEGIPSSEIEAHINTCGSCRALIKAVTNHVYHPSIGADLAMSVQLVRKVHRERIGVQSQPLTNAPPADGVADLGNASAALTDYRRMLYNASGPQSLAGILSTARGRAEA